MMQNPRFENFSLQNQKISPKLTLKTEGSEATFGQEQSLVIDRINMEPTKGLVFLTVSRHP
jgi:hypothetical protein